MPFKWCFAGDWIVAQDVLSKTVCRLGYMMNFIMRVNCMIKKYKPRMARKIEPISIITVCNVSVNITAAKPPVKTRRGNLNCRLQVN